MKKKPQAQQPDDFSQVEFYKGVLRHLDLPEEMSKNKAGASPGQPSKPSEVVPQPPQRTAGPPKKTVNALLMLLVWFDRLARAGLQAMIKARYWFLVFLLGAAAGAAGFYFYQWLPGDRLRSVKMEAAETRKSAPAGEVENLKLQLSNMRQGMQQLTQVFNSEKPPARPEVLRLGRGMLIYWIDAPLWREYFLYQAQGSGRLQKTTAHPTKKNFVYLPNLPAGEWRFAVSALDRNGNETLFSRVITISSK